MSVNTRERECIAIFGLEMESTTLHRLLCACKTLSNLREGLFEALTLGLLQERAAAGPRHRGHQQEGQQALPPHTEDR